MRVLPILMFLSIIYCSREPKIIIPKTTTLDEPQISYLEFEKSLKVKSELQKKKYFFQYVNYDVPKYWKGTKWSFNGTTKVPRQGSIACGYFVTNTLSAYGFKIKGNYLAQQASSVMIKQLCTDIRYFSTVGDLEKYLFERPENQVYLVGLDFHTGYITREKNDTYFIHSYYAKNVGVVKEKTASSPGLHSSKTFMIGKLVY